VQAWCNKCNTNEGDVSPWNSSISPFSILPHDAARFQDMLLVDNAHVWHRSVTQGSSSLHVDAAAAESVWEAGDRAFRARDSGLDAVEFLLAAGPAEPLRPLAAVVSGKCMRFCSENCF